jgi:hypothetical protein
MNLINTVFQNQNSEQDSPNEDFKNLIHNNSQSFLSSFPSIPFSQIIYGCYEANAQFNYGFSSEFDKNLLNVFIFYFLIIFLLNVKIRKSS